jgi:cold shock CspA family protein
VKVHEEHRNEAVVTRVLAEQGFGFLETTDGRQVYFHRNSVANDEFDRLRPGMGVHYVEEQGLDGPQAVAVWVVEKTGPGVSHTEERPG